jgi:hypothetical protein
MSVSALIFFFIFSLIILGMYISLRRELFNPTIVVAVGIISSTLAMMLTLKQMNDTVSNFQAVFFGFLIGGAFSLTTLAVAWYFHSNDLRNDYAEKRKYIDEE